jgi:hypothetical protein
MQYLRYEIRKYRSSDHDLLLSHLRPALGEYQLHLVIARSDGHKGYGRGVGCDTMSDITAKQIAVARAMVNKGNHIEA